MPQYEDIFQKLFGIPILPPTDYPALFDSNIEPERPILTVHSDAMGRLFARPMFWSLIPNFAPTFKPDPNHRWYNIRRESFVGKYKEGLLAHQRCVVPVKAFLESTRKREWFEFSHNSEDLLFLAAVYDIWQEKRLSCSIITTNSNETVMPIHHRMPFVISSNMAREWLDGSVTAVPRLKDWLSHEQPECLVRNRAQPHDEAQRELF